MPIVGIIGCWDIRTGSIKGNGKTTTLTYYLHEDFRSGRITYSNYETAFTQKMTTQDVFDIFRNKTASNISIGIDEIQKDISSIDPDIELIKEFCDIAAAQTRKKSIDLYWTSQRAMNVHKRLRIQTDYFIRPVRIHKDRSECQSYDCKKEHYIAVFSHQPYKIKPIIYLDCQEVGKLYDTNEILTDRVVV